MAGPRQILLHRTENYSSLVAKKLRSMREENALTDFTIISRGGFEIACHKLQLALHSPVFKAMLMTNMLEAAKQEVRLDHISKDTMEVILDYMYCGEENFHSDQLMDLIAACNYLQMTELMELCVWEVPASLEPSNVLSWWMQAHQMKLQTIQSKCEEMMAGEFKEVSKQPDFLALSHPLLQLYLRDVCDDSTESDDVLDAIMRWTEHDMDGRIIHLETLIQLVKLSNCTVLGIKAVIRTHDAIMDQQLTVYKLLNNTLMDLAESVIKSQAKKSVLLVVAGQVGANQVSPVVWTLGESHQIEEFCKIPFDKFRCGHHVCKTPTGFIITGYFESYTCIMFMAATKSWIRMQDMAMWRITHTSICVKGVLFLIAGYDAAQRELTGSVHFMNIEHGKWLQGPDLPVKGRVPNVADVDGSIYVLDCHKTKLLLRLDMEQQVWSKLASIPVDGRCEGASMASARDRLYVAGGEQGLCACYNVTTDSWCMGQQPLQLHMHGSVVYYNDKLLLLGGSWDNGSDQVEEYNMDDDTWSVCSYKMPAKLYRHSAFVLDMSPS